MTFGLHVSGPAAEAVDRTVPALVADLVASGITAQDPALWGAGAEADAARGLGWTEAIEAAHLLVPRIEALRRDLAASGVERIAVFADDGAASAADAIACTSRARLTVATGVGSDEVDAATAVVVTDADGGALAEALLHRAEAAFAERGIDAAERVIMVAADGSRAADRARAAGHRVVAAAADTGGWFSALSAHSLVPAGLAGADLSELIGEAEGVSLEAAVDDAHNPALRLAAAVAATRPRRDKLVIIEDGTHLRGVARWLERLIAGATGGDGTGIIPVVAGPSAPEAASSAPDLQIVRLVADASAHHLLRSDRHRGEILVSGSLGAQFLVWEYAIAAACRILGADPFERPGEADAPASPRDAAAVPTVRTVTVPSRGGSASAPVADAIADLIARVPADGYLTVLAYADRAAVPWLADLRDLLAARSGRPVVFDWEPGGLRPARRLHIDGPAVGGFLQIVVGDASAAGPDHGHDPGRTRRDDAARDAAMLAGAGRPVATVALTDPSENLPLLFAAVDQ